MEAVADRLPDDHRAKVHTAEFDVLDADAVDRHAAAIVRRAGHLDISFNLVGLGDAQGAPLVDITADHFLGPIQTAMRAHFVTGTAAVRQMRPSGSGVILTLTAQASRKPYVDVGGFGVACAALEALSRQLAAEADPLGIRVVCLRSAGSPDTPGVAEAWSRHARSAGLTMPEWQARIADGTLLKRLPRLDEVARTAVIMASDYASPVTAAVTNVTCGELTD